MRINLDDYIERREKPRRYNHFLGTIEFNQEEIDERAEEAGRLFKVIRTAFW